MSALRLFHSFTQWGENVFFKNIDEISLGLDDPADLTG